MYNEQLPKSFQKPDGNIIWCFKHLHVYIAYGSYKSDTQ